MPTESAGRAIALVRDGSHFQWHVIPILLLVLYVYANEIERRNWNVVFAGLALWCADWLNEIANALIFHFTQYAPLWATPKPSAYTIFIGLNLEISFMFAIMGIVVAKTLPRGPDMRILGMPNRWFMAGVGSAFAVLVEIWLNSIGQLTWDYWWWSARMPLLIFVFGYLWFFVFAFWVYDLPSLKQKARAVIALGAFDAAAIVLFAGVLGWI
jgi:uncharacterized membrane protein